MAIIAIVNEKGGVGKTTTAANLGAALALTGRDVMLVDLDPQGSLTQAFGLVDEQRLPEHTVSKVLREEVPALDAAVPTSIEGLSLIAADKNLITLETELQSLPDWALLVTTTIRPALSAVDHIIIDTPGSFGLYMLMALVGADIGMLVVQCEMLPALKIADVYKSFARVRRMNPGLQVRILQTMVDTRLKEATAIDAKIRAAHGDEALATTIRRSIYLSRAVAAARPWVAIRPEHEAAADYFALATELVGAPKEIESTAYRMAAGSEEGDSMAKATSSGRPTMDMDALLDRVLPASASSAPEAKPAARSEEPMTATSPKGARPVTAQIQNNSEDGFTPAIAHTHRKDGPPVPTNVGANEGQPHDVGKKSKNTVQTNFSWREDDKKAFQRWFRTFCNDHNVDERVGYSRFSLVAVQYLMKLIDEGNLPAEQWQKLLPRRYTKQG